MNQENLPCPRASFSRPSSLVAVAVAVIGAVTAGGLAMASPATKPTVKVDSPHYVAPTGSHAGSLTFSAEVHDASGVRGLKVLVWPAMPSSIRPRRRCATWRAPRAAALLTEPLAASTHGKSAPSQGGGRAGPGHLVHLDAGDGKGRGHRVPAPPRHLRPAPHRHLRPGPLTHHRHPGRRGSLVTSAHRAVDKSCRRTTSC